MAENAYKDTSLRRLLTRFRWRILGTWLLVIVEAGLTLLFPLAVGIAIDGLLQKDYFGLCLLGVIVGLSVVIGAARRFYDTRLYARFYTQAVEQIVAQERDRDATVSVISARTSMARELVEFLENSFPVIIDCVIGLVGTLVLIWSLQSQVLVACLAATCMIVCIFAITSGTTLSLNKGANDESEKTVEVITDATPQDIASHFSRLMRWNIRLSDLETVTFSLSWLVMLAVLLFSVVATIESGIISQGKVLSILMYVFGYIESVIALPIFYQQFVRLQEIVARLEAS